MHSRLMTLSLVVLTAAISSGCVRSSTYQKSAARQKATQTALEKCLGDVDAKTAELGEATNKLASAEAKVTNLQVEVEKERKTREHNEQMLSNLQGNLKTTRSELEAVYKQRAESEKRLKAWKDLTARFKKMIDAGRIKVRVREGRMLLDLPSEILFASGAATLAAPGQEALKEVAAALKEFADRSFLVAGHTDNVPLRGKKFKDNWELSTARALTVTQFLISEGVSAENLGAAGYGEFDPVAENSGETGRQANRRIEIILVPNLEELPQLPEE